LLSNTRGSSAAFDCVFTLQEGAELADSVDPFFAEDIIDAGLRSHVRGQTAQFTNPFSGGAHHSRELLWADDDQGDQRDESDL
jgi:hypothetical protein